MNTQTKVEIYCDGSYNETTGKSGYCSVVVVNNNFHRRLEGTIENPLSRQIDGECKAFIHALHYCKLNGILNPTIYFDYAGIEGWYTGTWKAKTDIAKKFVLALAKYRIVRPTLIKVAGHSSSTPAFLKSADNFAKNMAL